MIAEAKRVARDDGYGRSSRFYDVEGVGKLPSVTTILQAVAKPALINWAAKVEREMVRQAAANLWEDLQGAKMSRTAYLASLDERIPKQKAHQKELQKAGDIGTQAHALIEWNLRKEMGQEVGAQPEVESKALWAFKAYEDWRKSVALVPKLIEQTVYSAKYGYAGTMDLYGMLAMPDGQQAWAVGDWKTGKAIYGEALLQNAAYVRALIEMGHGAVPCSGFVVRLPKVETDPEFEVKYITFDEIRSNFMVFLNVLEVWRWMESA